MIAADTNILVYARRTETPFHRQARGCSIPPAMRQALTSARATGNLVHDAHIAALLLEHGVRELWTADRNFSRFPALRVRHPFG